MKSKFVLATSLAVLFLGSLSQAIAAPKPEKCPGVNAIRSVNFNDVVQVSDDKWAAVQFNNTYDTQNSWDFVIGSINATDSDEAMDKLTASMSSLALWQGPVGNEEMYMCLYITQEEGVGAIALSPSQMDSNKLTKLLR